MVMVEEQMSAAEIKAELAALGVSAAGCYEKGDLIERLRQARIAGQRAQPAR
jgi:hypothetical protein